MNKWKVKVIHVWDGGQGGSERQGCKLHTLLVSEQQ